MRGKRPDESIELLDAALRKRATSPELLNSRCWVKALAGVDLGNALADCTRAIELAADPAAYFDSRALVHYRAGEMDAALADINAALALNPELAPTRYLRGVIAKQQGRGKDAATDLGVARQLDPSIDGLFARYGINP
jgi:tetratricopeptide (TPR) repeat protein